MITQRRVGQKIEIIGMPEIKVQQPASVSAAVAWYLSGGISAANCIAAFKPKGAASLAASYVNLASGGATWDAAPGNAPTLDANGWVFNGTSNYLIVGSGAIVSGIPLSMVAYFNADTVTADCLLCTICRTSVEDNRFMLYAAGTVGGDPILAFTKQGATQAIAISTSGYAAGSWYSAVAVFSAINSRAAYIGGGGKGTNATSVTPTGLNITLIGARHSSSSFGGYYDGSMAACAFYNTNLSDAQALALHTAMAAL